MDKFKSMLLEGYLKKQFSSYLENGALSVDLNTGNCSCVFVATLAGESEPLTVDIKKFEIHGEKDQKFLRVTEVSSTRKWVDCALNGYLKDKDFKLPSLVASAL